MLYNTAEGTVRLKTGTMDYAAFGHGRKPIVLIPGLSLRRVKGSGLMLAQMYRLFCKEYRVVVFDRRNELFEGITASDFAEDIAEGMDILGIKCAHVVGISQGGMIAQYLALDHPERTARLVLGVTLSRPNDTLRQSIDTWVSLVRSGDMNGFLDDMLRRCYSDEYIRRFERVFPLVLRFTEVIPAERFITLAESCLTCDTYDRLGELRRAVLVLGGRKDKVVTGEASEEMAARLGERCTLHMYEEYGHSAYEEAKDFNQRIADHLAGRSAFDV